MRVKDLATLTGTTVRTIRYYHQLGLLAVPEPSTTWRSYGFAHLTRLMRIRWLVDSGVPLAEVPHLLRPAATADERHVVVDDLEAVLASIDERVATLTAQRERVRTLLDRVRADGGLTPLPPPVVRLYERLLARPLSAGVREAVLRERDLLELLCYRVGLPADVVSLVDAMTDDDLDAACELWEEVQQVQARSTGRLGAEERERIRDVARRTVALAERVEPEAARSLRRRAAALDRPAARAAADLAFPSAAYREFLTDVVSVAQDRTAAS